MSTQGTLSWPIALIAVGVAAGLAGCAVPREAARGPSFPGAAEERALVARLLPASLADRTGWASDIHAAMSAMQIAPSAENVCAVVAITEQESGFRVDPPIPNLPAIARKEIDRQRERAGIPKLVLDAALAMPSSDGRSYRERLDAAKTELQLSEIFEDFIGQVPLAKTFLADRNPVHTGGPMQVSVAFAQRYARSYPYPIAGSIRQEVFTRRGGMYFGIAHLLDYPAPYEGYIHRFADFNAGRYASRNAAFQKAVAEMSSIALELDGDLVRYEKGWAAAEPGATELATRALARRLEMSSAEIRRDLELGKLQEFERSRLYSRVFALAERQGGKAVPRAVVPRIVLQSPKLTRRLTTDGFARRVAERHRTCLARASSSRPS